MGASGWRYFVPYEAGIQGALAKLRAAVKKSGKYDKGMPEDGTHSILDIERASPTPVAAKGELGFGVVAPLPEAELVALLGTARPTRAIVEAKADDIEDLRRRWTGTYVVIYAGDEPTELLFTGFSGD